MAAPAEIPDLLDELANLKARLDRLERGNTITVIKAAPADNPPDGVVRLQATGAGAPRLWARANGAWHYAALT